MINVRKRNGQLEPLDINKLHKVVFWACEDIAGVSVSEIELRAQISLEEGISTKHIQETLIKSAADLISEEHPNYDRVSARLVYYNIRKEVYGGFTPWHIRDIVKKNVELGYYDPDLLEYYNDEDFNELEAIIKHERDDLLRYAGMEQFRGKYLIKNRVTGQFFETPQVCNLLVAATLYMKEDKSARMVHIKELYDAISTFDISLPTPIMGGVRSVEKQGASCVLIDCDDTTNSICASSTAIKKYICNKAGIGLNVGRIRAIGSEIKNGKAEHTGLIPLLTSFQGDVKSFSQGGIRGGSATVFFQWWHYEFPELIVLKNNKGTEYNRVRHLDYGVQMNRIIYKRLIEGGDITLFSPKDVPGLNDAFYRGDNEAFEKLYAKFEKDKSIRKRTVSAKEWFTMFMTERRETGRIYLQNIDHCNTHSSFKPDVAPITMSNLCKEITLPTIPLEHEFDENGRIALCILGANNLGKIKKPEDFEKSCRVVVRALDALIDYQDYMLPAAREFSLDYRALGVGVINLAYWLAKNDLKYDEDAIKQVAQLAEAHSYYLIKASVDLAKEKGPCRAYKNTKYSEGILPIDTANKNAMALFNNELHMPWEELREDLKTYGIRNATVMALMPSETSSQLSNATNGVEPPRSLISDKTSKHGRLAQVVPEIGKLKNKYDLLWDQSSPDGYLKLMAVYQVFVDQSISTNVSVNPENYPDNQVSMMDLITHLLNFYKLGGKTLYYHNTYDGQGDETVTKPVETVATPLAPIVEDDEDCDSCKI